MNQLTVFEQREVLGRNFKMYGDIENPLFLAKDVAEWIEHSDRTKMLKVVDEGEKVKNIIPTAGGIQEMWFLTEDGLYEVLMQSRKPIAKEYKKEVKAILKQIRKTGGYIPVSAEESDEEFLARALMVAQRTLDKKDEIIKMKDRQLQEQAPKVEAYDQYFVSEDVNLKFNALAKNFDIGVNKLYELLRKGGVLQDGRYTHKKTGKQFTDKQKHNVPYQKYMARGFFKVKYGYTDYGTPYAITYVTPKGQEFIRRALIKNGYLEKRAA